MPKIMGLIFDLDGTLLDSAPDLRNALNQMLALNHRPPVSLDQIKTMVGDGMLALMQRTLTATGGHTSADEMARFKEFVGFYRSLEPDPSQVYPGARETLEKYYGMGIKLGLCTNKTESATLYILKQLDLLRYFEFIAGGDTFMVHKPNPEHINGVITALDVPKENCVMIGDGRNDVAVAHNAGIPCIVSSMGYDDHTQLNADAIMDSFDELPALLEKIGFTL